MSYKYDKKNSIGSPTKAIFSEFPCVDTSIKISNLAPVKTNNHQIILGTGTFSDVYLAKDIETDQLYAIKHMEKSLLMKTMHTLQIIYNEMSLHSRLIHPNIIRLYNTYENSTSIYLIMEYASNGNLYSLLKRKGVLTEKEARKYFIQISNIISFLHKNNIIHRDIKPENLLLDDKDNVKLCDFGWANFVNDSNSRSTFCGTMEYMAPEILNKEQYNKGIDIWALGVLLYELIHGYPPFSSDNKPTDYQDMLKHITEHGFKIREDISDNCKDILQKMLKVDSKERISIEDILKHPFIKEETGSFKKRNRRALSDKHLIFTDKKKGGKVSNFTKMILGSDLSFLDDDDINEGTKVNKVTVKPPQSTKNKIVLTFNVFNSEQKPSPFNIRKTHTKIVSKSNLINKMNVAVKIKDDEQRNTGTSSNDMTKDNKDFIDKVDEFLDSFI